MDAIYVFVRLLLQRYTFRTVTKRLPVAVTQRFKGATNGLQLYADGHAKRDDYDVDHYQNVRVVRHHHAFHGVKQYEVFVVPLRGHKRKQKIEHVQMILGGRVLYVPVRVVDQQRRYHPENARRGPQQGKEIGEIDTSRSARARYVISTVTARQELDGRKIDAIPNGFGISNHVVALERIVSQHNENHRVHDRVVIIVQTTVNAPTARDCRHHVNRDENVIDGTINVTAVQLD